MDNDNTFQTSNTEDQTNVSSIESQITQETDPTSLAEAFQKVNEREQKDSQNNVENAAQQGNNGGLQNSETVLGSSQNNETLEPSVQQSSTVESGISSGISGGSGTDATQPTEFDKEFSKKQILDNLHKQAEDMTMQYFMSNDNLKPKSIDDITIRNEDGTLEFMNVDDGTKFSNRSEAQAWIKSWNEYVNGLYVKQAKAVNDDLIKQAQPIMNLIEVVPDIQKLSEDEIVILDQMIEQFAVKNNGQIVGYTCELGPYIKKAKQICKKFNSKKAEAKTELPSTDMKTSGSSSPSSTTEEKKEPKDVAEAMAMVMNK